MAQLHWFDSNGNWNTAANWTGGGVPGSTDDAVIDAAGSYTVSENASPPIDANSITISDSDAVLAITNVAGNQVGSGGVTNSGTFGLHDNTTLTVDGGFTNTGTLDVDNVFNVNLEIDEGGSSLMIGGTLANSGTVQIGDPYYALSAPTSVTLGGLTNPSGASFLVYGSASRAGALVFSSGGAGFTSNGGDFEMSYAAPLTLTAAFTNSGTFGLHYDTVLSVDGGFTNGGTLDVDNVFNVNLEIDEGGSSLTIDGTLANSGTVQIGDPYYALSAPTSVTLGGLTNPSGASFLVYGSASHAAALVFSSGGAGFTSNGGDFEMSYAAPLTLTAAFTNSGTFGLHYDTVLSVDGGFTNGGTLDVDNVFNVNLEIDEGGSSLTIDGTLANSGTVQIGDPYYALSAPTSVTLGGLTNPSGASFLVYGSASHAAALVFSSGGAGFISNGGDFEMSYAAPLTLTAAFTNSGTFGLHYDTAVTINGGFTNSGTLDVDNVLNVNLNIDEGGSSLTIDGTLANNGTVQIGNPYLSATTSLTLGGLTNTGSISISSGSSTQQVVLTVNAATTTSGAITLTGSSELLVSGGNTFTETAGTTTLNAGGTLAAATIDVTGGLLDFTSAITAASGTGNFKIVGNGVVEFGGAVDAGHSVTFTSTAGTMELGAPGQFAPTIDGFAVGDKIDLLQTEVTGLSYADDVLTVTNGGTTVASLNIVGGYSTSDFTFVSDNNGGNDIELAHNPAQPTEPTPYDFNGDGDADILWQNTDGQPAIWLMNGTTPFDEPAVGSNPGASWQVIGAGNFYGPGTDADILWQNTDGQAAIWVMNGTTPVGEPVVGANPGPSWQIVGTGYFNGLGVVGDSDILWQDTNGQAAIWVMNGVIPVSEPVVGANPGPSWRIVGIGDFNGDGNSDILWQNTNGQAAIWLMDGTTPLSEPVVGANPGPSWHIVGTGNFSGNGDSDIVWQNTNGQVAIWVMNGTTPIAEPVIGNPEPSWQVVGTGNYAGGSQSDLLFQNTNGQASIWLMNGTTPTSEVLVSSNPGPSWHIHAAS